MDKEFELLELINKDCTYTQRQLSEQTGLSLGSVNILLKKLVREGLVKLQRIPANRVAYMLTPEGAREKVRKTLFYLKVHYQEIERARKGLASIISKIPSDNLISVRIEDPVLKMMVMQLLNQSRVEIVENSSVMAPVIILTDQSEYRESDCVIINILEEWD